MGLLALIAPQMLLPPALKSVNISVHQCQFCFYSLHVFSVIERAMKLLLFTCFITFLALLNARRFRRPLATF